MYIYTHIHKLTTTKHNKKNYEIAGKFKSIYILLHVIDTHSLIIIKL